MAKNREKLAELDRLQVVREGVVRYIGTAFVLPITQTSLAAQLEQQSDITSRALVRDDRIEMIGMDYVMQYEQQRGWLFGFLLATLVISVLKDVLLTGRLPGGMNLGFHALLGTACVVGLTTRRARVHEVLAIACAAVMALYIATLFARLA